MVEWAAQKLTPSCRQAAGSTASNSSTHFGLSAEPGTYELHFLCDGPPRAELSASTWAGAEVLASVQVNCDGEVFKATVQLGTEGVDLKMNPGSGQDARYAFRLVPSS